MSERVKQKWRPKLWAVVLLVLGLVLSLPIAGLVLFQLYADQLIQQTEESLIGQASVLAATYSELYQATNPTDLAALPLAPIPQSSALEGYTPVFPSLSFSRNAVLQPRPNAVPSEAPAAAPYLEIGQAITEIAKTAQQQTLAGYRVLDASGTVIGGTAELGLSLAHIDEVKTALAGHTTSVARKRIRSTQEPLIYGLSPGTRVRVFVALPVLVNGHVVGAVYLNRTPNHIFRFLYAERFNLLKAVAFVLVATGMIGFVFWRFITQPLHALISRTKLIDQNHAHATKPLKHLGTKEIADLSQSFEAMTKSLQNRQDAIKTYTAHVTHELKSPLTAVQGAAELLKESSKGMTVAQQQKFLNNILSDTARMASLLQAMRAFAEADQPPPSGQATLDEWYAQHMHAFGKLDIELINGHIQLPVHLDTLTIALTHLLENAIEHGASKITLTAGSTLTVSDNGMGISTGNREKVMTPFFTTRRETGGTGMGLNIIKSMLATTGGRIEVLDQEKGAGFKISF